MNGGRVEVRIKHGDFEVVFEGEKEEVWEMTNRYFSEKVGYVEVVSRLAGAADVSDLAHKLVGKVVVNSGKIDVLFSGDSKRKILLCLAGAWVGKRLGMFDSDFLPPKQLAVFLRMDERAVRARLSELYREALVDKDEQGRYCFKPVTGIKMIED